MKKVSEVIKALQEMQNAYGDLPVTIAIHHNNEVVSSQELFFGHNQFDDKSDEINIRSFLY